MMDRTTCGVINVPFSCVTIMACVFFVFCMICPLQGQRLKQPLKLLLGSMISCKVVFLSSAVAVYCVDVTTQNLHFVLALHAMLIWSLASSMNSSVLLNFLYYTQIVPAQTTLFTWIKKNIKPIIYCTCFAEAIGSFLDVSIFLSDILRMADIIQADFTYNLTMTQDSALNHILASKSKSNWYKIAFIFVQVHFYFCVFVMVMCSGSTTVYLTKHIHRMVANGQSFSSRHFRNQVRVTVTGILQGVLFFCCSLWTQYRFFSDSLSKELFNIFSYLTAFNLYMTGTMLNLAVGQSVFRRRIEHIYNKAAQCCKAAEDPKT